MSLAWSSGYVRSDEIVGYTYQAELLCPGCTAEAFLKTRTVKDYVREDLSRVEEMLDFFAKAEGIDREDLYSYDSDDFPKPLLACQANGHECCDECGGELL